MFLLFGKIEKVVRDRTASKCGLIRHRRKIIASLSIKSLGGLDPELTWTRGFRTILGCIRHSLLDNSNISPTTLEVASPSAGNLQISHSYYCRTVITRGF